MRRSHDFALRPDVAPSGEPKTPQQETPPPSTPPAVEDGQVLTRGRTFPKARREEEMELPGMLNRCVKLITGVKKIVAEMREANKNVISHREKCSMILSAAMAASVALDQALYTGNLGLANEKELQMLCTEVSSVLALGETRIRVYGLQPRWKKYMKQLSGRRTESKFDEVVQQLTQLTQKAWTLQEGPNANSNPRFDLARVTRTPRSRRTFSGTSWAASPRPVDAPLLPPADANPQVMLSRTRLRRGGQRRSVRSILYIPPERSTGAKASLGQVWWYVGGCFTSELAVHNLAKNETKAVKTNRNMPAVTVMAQDITGNVWTGHLDGYIRVWSEASQNPVCPPFRAMHSDIKCITMDDSGVVWVGAASGDVSAVALAMVKQPHGGLSKRIELRTALKWGAAHGSAAAAGAAGAAGSLQDTPSTRTPSSISSLASSWGTFGQRVMSLTQDSLRAHGGAVLAIAAQGGRVWTSGSDMGGPTLREWSATGKPGSSVALGAFGAANAIMTMPRYVNVVRPDIGASAAAEQAEEGSATSQSTSSSACLGERQPSGKSVESLWQLMTAHECGQCQLWDIGRGALQPIAVLGSPTFPARALLLCEEIGLWGTAHTDGSIILRLLPTGAEEERHRLTLAPNGPVPSLNIPHFRAPFCAHRGGLEHAVGSGACIVTAGRLGSIIMWPEVELRSVAEAVGFVLPTRSPLVAGDSKRVSISQVLQRYFTPHSAAMAEYALASAVMHRMKSNRAVAMGESSRLSPVQSIGDKEGDEAQQLIEEVANMLRSSTSSGNGPAAAEAATRAASLASDLTSSLQSTQGRPSLALATTANPTADSTELSLCSLTKLPHAKTEPVGEVGRVELIAEDISDIRLVPRVPSAPSMAANDSASASGQDLQSLQGSLKSSSLGTWPISAFSPNWIIPYSELTLKKQIGEGSLGRVHLGRWQETDVAIKVLNSLSSIGVAAADPADPKASQGEEQKAPPSSSADDSMRLSTLEREVNIMAALRHPNVVLFMGVCLEPPCVVSEWCARGSLFDVLIKARSTPALQPQLDWGRRLNMALDAAKGMLQLHTKQIIHRDLKSPNLLVDKHWRVKVCDFNLSRVESSEHDKSSSISANNPRWLAPEVIASQAYSKAADVYSFGVILWELSTWQLPWEELGVFQIMVSVSEKQLRPDMPAEPRGGAFEGWAAYTDLIQRCWAHDPVQRPTFEGVIATLRELLTETATLSRQRRLTEKESNDASSGPPTPRYTTVEASEPQQVPGAVRQVSLGQVHGLARAQPGGEGNKSSASPSGFTIPLLNSECGSSTHRSSMRLSSTASTAERKSTSFERPQDPVRRALQQSAALNAANAHTLGLLTADRASSGNEQELPAAAAAAAAGAAAKEHQTPGQAAQQPVTRMTDGSSDQPVAVAQSDDAATGAAAAGGGGGSFASPFGDAEQQTAPEGPESVAEVRELSEIALEGARSVAESSLGDRKLSKVEEVQSSMERGSDSESGLTMDSQGRQGRGSVLQGIHEQERSQQGSSSSASAERTKSWALGPSSSGSTSSGGGQQLPTAPTPDVNPAFLGIPGMAASPTPAGHEAAEHAVPATGGECRVQTGGSEDRGPAVPGRGDSAAQLPSPFAMASQAAPASGSEGTPSQTGSGELKGHASSGEQKGDGETKRGGRALAKVWATGKKALGLREAGSGGSQQGKHF